MIKATHDSPAGLEAVKEPRVTGDMLYSFRALYRSRNNSLSVTIQRFVEPPCQRPVIQPETPLNWLHAPSGWTCVHSAWRSHPLPPLLSWPEAQHPVRSHFPVFCVTVVLTTQGHRNLTELLKHLLYTPLIVT